MDKKKTAIRAGAALVVALAAGHLVQTMNAEKKAEVPAPKAIEQVSSGPEAAAPVADAVLPATASVLPVSPTPAPVSKVEAEPEMPVAGALAADTPATDAPATDDTLLAALPEISPVEPETGPGAMLDGVQTAPAVPDSAAAPLAAPEPAVPLAEACSVAMTLKAGPQAMIGVSISAPCRAGERVVLRHAGLAVAEQLSESGMLDMDLPALQAQGEVTVLFPDATVLHDSVAVPDATKVHRFGVQWMADDAFQLHAFEAGAGYGDPGDVWSGAPVSPSGGYLVALGNPSLDLPMLAEIYTYPADAAQTADLAVESAVTELTCGRELLGETLMAQDGAVTITDLTLAMPDCDAVGDILVLKNPGQDVTLAAVD